MNPSSPPPTPGDELIQEFEPFFRCMSARMMASAYRQLRNEHDAEETVAQVWTEYSAEFPFGRSFPASERPKREIFLMTRTGYRCQDAWRTRGRRKERNETDFASPDPGGMEGMLAKIEVIGPTGTDSMLVEEEKKIIRQCRDQLPTHLRLVYVLCYEEGFSLKEIAGHLEILVGTVKSRLNTIRARMKECLTASGYFGERTAEQPPWEGE